MTLAGPRPPGRRSKGRQLAAQALAWPILLTVIVVVGGMASWIATRRWSGYGQTPPTGLLVATGFAEMVLLVVLHEWQRASSGGRLTRQSLWGHAALTAVALGLATAVSFPEAPTLGVVALWSFIAVAETWWWGRHGGAPAARWSQATAPRPKQLDPSPSVAGGIRPDPPRIVVSEGTTVADEEAAGEFEDEERDESGPLLKPGVVQQWTRGVDENGREWIDAIVRVEFQPGQRHAMVHLAFCPPLAQAPEVNAEIMEGLLAEVVVAQSRPYGVRFELRRTGHVALNDYALLLVRVNR